MTELTAAACAASRFGYVLHLCPAGPRHVLQLSFTPQPMKHGLTFNTLLHLTGSFAQQSLGNDKPVTFITERPTQDTLHTGSAASSCLLQVTTHTAALTHGDT